MAENSPDFIVRPGVHRLLRDEQYLSVTVEPLGVELWLKPVPPWNRWVSATHFPVEDSKMVVIQSMRGELDGSLIYGHEEDRPSNRDLLETMLTDRIGTLEAVLAAPVLSSALRRTASEYLTFLNGIGSDVRSYLWVSDLIRPAHLVISPFRTPNPCKPACIGDPEPRVSELFQLHQSEELVRLREIESRRRALSEIRRIRAAYLPDCELGPYTYNRYSVHSLFLI